MLNVDLDKVLDLLDDDHYFRLIRSTNTYNYYSWNLGSWYYAEENDDEQVIFKIKNQQDEYGYTIIEPVDIGDGMVIPYTIIHDVGCIADEIKCSIYVHSSIEIWNETETHFNNINKKSLHFI
jgi:hypothetical protein